MRSAIVRAKLNFDRAVVPSEKLALAVGSHDDECAAKAWF